MPHKPGDFSMTHGTVCFSFCSAAVKRHQDQGNSNKIKHLIGACWQLQRVISPCPSRQEADRNGPGAESFIASSTGSREREGERERQRERVAKLPHCWRFTPVGDVGNTTNALVYKLVVEHCPHVGPFNPVPGLVQMINELWKVMACPFQDWTFYSSILPSLCPSLCPLTLREAAGQLHAMSSARETHAVRN